MPFLQTLREARYLVRWMLVWFALSIGVAVAAPVFHPQALALVCTTDGKVRFVAEPTSDKADGAPAGMQAHALDCVLCLPFGAPPSADLELAAPLAAPRELATTPPAHVPARFVQAASARGPPAHV